MSEARKSKPSLNPFVFETHFLYEGQAPIIEVEKSLEAQNSVGGLFGSYASVVTLIDASNYTIVRSHIRRRRRQATYPTGRVNAVLWQGESGQIYLEGTAQVDGFSFYSWMAITAIIGFFALVGSILWTPLPFIGVLGLGAFIVWEFLQDRNTALETLREGFMRVSELQSSAAPN